MPDWTLISPACPGSASILRHGLWKQGRVEEPAMTAFVHQTLSDIRRGRDSWRVVFFFSAFSFAISVAAALISSPV